MRRIMEKMKGACKGAIKKVSGAFRYAVPAGVGVVACSTASHAALDLTAVSTSIADAITDFSAAGVLLLGFYAAIWGVKAVKNLFARGA